MNDLSDSLITPEMLDEIVAAADADEELPYTIKDIRISQCRGFILINMRRENERSYSIRVRDDLELAQRLCDLIEMGILPSHEGATFNLRRGALIYEPPVPVFFHIAKGKTN